MNIEKNLEKLNEYLAELENNTSITLEKSLKLYEEAILIAKECFKDIEKGKGELNLLNSRLEKLTRGEYADE